MTKQEFIHQIAGYVQKYAPQYEIKCCSAVIAQAILESGWGESRLAAQYHNYFGLKCGTKWTGPSVNMATLEEYQPGTLTTIKDNFRVYGSMEKGVKGYFEFIQLSRYQNLKGIKDPQTYLETIKADGYATSSNYVANTMAVVNQYNLTQYDKGGNEMNKTEAINKVLSLAKAEVGYLEKASNSSLDSKTANAGSNNYTKYWRDIYPSYQGQPWCAVFVTWVFQQAFGKETAKKMLKHYPYVYVPTLMNLFTRYANPEVGDIVCFYRNGEFAHTGIVTKVSGDRFWTIEGNTSGTSGVVANGGGVCEKSYYNSQLPGTKFARPDWSLATTEELKIDATHWLKKGDSGTLVKEIQEDLIYLGFSCGPDGADGEYGDNTVKAVKAAQKAYGLTQDGQYGLKTKNAVDKAVEEKRKKEETNKLQTAVLDKVTLPYIKKGSKGVGVSMLQTMLGTKVTGTFNDDDVKAFKEFQKNTRQSQDGICGENGWKAVVAHILANTK